MLVGAVGGRGAEQVAMFWPNPLGVAMRDRREKQKLLRHHLEPLLANPALAQQDPLTPVEQRMYDGAPLLECGHGGRLRHRVPASRPATSARRSGGTVFGG